MQGANQNQVRQVFLFLFLNRDGWKMNKKEGGDAAALLRFAMWKLAAVKKGTVVGDQSCAVVVEW